MAVIQLTSPLILASDPTLPLHPVTKRYADAKVNILDASGFSSGTLSVARLPQFLGDVTMPAGGGTLTLTPTGVAPGTYTKLTVSASGRILAGAALSAIDVPPVSWNKIVSGKPTTLAGYGITDALTATGGTITGDLSITTSPVNNYHLANKNYVDGSIVPGGDSIVVGDVVRMANVATPTGFLRANGGRVSKTTYAALYSVIGDRYEALMSRGTELPWLHQSVFNMTGVLSGQTKEYTIPFNAYGPEVGMLAPALSSFFVLKNKFYAIGGYAPDGASYGGIGICYRWDINSDGTLANGERYLPFTAFYGLYFEYQYLMNFTSKVFMVKNNLYIIVYDKLYKSVIDAAGNPGTPVVVMTIPFDNYYYSIKPVVIGNKLYLFDYLFSPGSTQAYVVSFDINSNGDINNLTSYGIIDPSVLRKSVDEAFVYKNKVYLVTHTLTSGIQYTVYTADINSDNTLGPWVAGPSIAQTGDIYVKIAIPTTDGIYIFFRSSTGSGSGSYPAAVYKLNTDSVGVPTSWTKTLDIAKNVGATGANWYGCETVAITKNHFYTGIRVSPTTPYSNTYVFTMEYIDFTGGLNDYSPYYDGSLSEKDPLNFFLPNFTAKETASTKYFIKT